MNKNSEFKFNEIVYNAIFSNSNKNSDVFKNIRKYLCRPTKNKNLVGFEIYKLCHKIVGKITQETNKDGIINAIINNKYIVHHFYASCPATFPIINRNLTPTNCENSIFYIALDGTIASVDTAIEDSDFFRFALPYELLQLGLPKTYKEFASLIKVFAL